MVLVRSIPSTTNAAKSAEAFVSLPAAGSRKTGSDAGTQWPDPRFGILTSGSKDDTTDDIVVDYLTGLFWARNAHPAGKKNWHDALTYCNDLKLGGYDDWRMPNVFEMLSVICYVFNSPSLSNTSGDSKWKEADPFMGVMNDLYWTSTTEEPYILNSYVVNLKDGTIDTAYGPPLLSLLDRTMAALGGKRPKVDLLGAC